MPLFAAASINIDLAMFFAFLFLAGLVALIILGIKSTVSYVCGNNDDKPTRHVRTRNSKPIDKDIAEFLHREYPNRKPAQFV